METINIKPITADIVDAESKAVAVLDQEAGALAIKTPDDYQAAGELRSRLKGKIKRLDEMRKSAVDPLNTAVKVINGWFKTPAEKLTNAVARVDSLTIAYDDEQQRRAQEEQARLNAKAEKERLAAEAKAKEFADKGKTGKQDEWLEKASTIVAPVVEAAVPKVGGQGIRIQWYGEVVDFKALPDEYKLPNMSAIDKVAGALKDKTAIAGVVIRSRKIVSGRSS